MDNTGGGKSQDLTYNDCEACGGCIICGETLCIFYSGGNPENCNMGRCRHCVLYLQKQRLFLGNVG